MIEIILVILSILIFVSLFLNESVFVQPFRLKTYIFLLAAVCFGSSARADLILTLQDASIAADGTGFMNVFIRSNGTDRLTFASYDFKLTGTPGTTLEFIDPQDYSEQGLGNYVLAGQNLGINQVMLNNSQLVADDAQDGSGLGYRELTGTDLLLTRLDLRHVLGPGQTAASSIGHQFQITLDLISGDTLFLDDNLPLGNPLTIDQVNSKLIGTVTVTSAAAVSEPSSLMLLAMAGGMTVLRRRYRKHHGTLE